MNDTPVEVRRPKGLPFVQVSTEIVRDTRISAQARMIYVLIATHADVNDRDASLYRRTLAQYIGKSVDTVDRCLRELVEAGYLIIEQLKRESGDLTASAYVLHEPHLMGGSRTHAARSPHPCGEGGRTDAARVAAPMRHKGTRDFELEPNNDRSTSAEADDALPIDVPSPDLVQTQAGPRGTGAAVGFDQFWDAYPKKADKGAARRAWVKAIKKVDRPSVIIRAALVYRSDPNRDPQFTKHPATWLNNEAWLNDPEPERSNGHRPDTGASPWDVEPSRG